MTENFSLVAIGEVATPIERAEIPIAGQQYRQLGVQLWGKGAYERETIDGGQTKYNTLSRVETGDIVVNKIWARNGSVAVVPGKLAGCYVSSEFPTFLPKLGKLTPEWFYWITKTKPFWEQCDEKSRGTSGQNRIRPEKFLEIKIPVPTLEEQCRIVARIEELAAKIEEAKGWRQAATTEVDQFTRRQLTEVFDRLANDYGQTDFNELIDGAGYGTSVRCDHERVQNAIPVLRIPNIASERVHFGDLKYGFIPESESIRTILKAGDILIVRTNGSAELVGRCAVVPQTSEPTAFASYLIRLRPNKEKVDSHYLQWALRHLRLDGRLFDLARTTAGQYNVSLGRLYATRIPLPSLEEQRRIVAYLDDLQAKVDVLKRLQAETAAELDALLPSILDKAFKGEL